MFKPVRVASAWQENIAARVRPRSEKRWRVSRAQPWLATLLQLLMLSEQLKSVVSLPEASDRLRPPATPPIFSDAGNDTGKAPAPDLPVAPPLRQAASSGSADNTAAQRLASELSTLEQTLLAGTSFDFPDRIPQTVRQVRQAPGPSRRIRHARHRAAMRTIASNADTTAATTGAAISADTAAEKSVRPSAGAIIRSRLDRLAPVLLSDYLTAQGYATSGKPSGCAQDTAVLTALHLYLQPAGAFVGDPASLDRLDQDALGKLMRHVAQKSGFYGARDGEQSAPEFQRQTLIRLVFPWVRDCIPISAARSADSDPPAMLAYETVADIRQAEHNRLQTAGLSADAARWVNGLLWADAEPTLARADTPGDLRHGHGSLDWADLQGGVDIAIALGLDHWAMDHTELAALAQAGDMAARLEPEAAAGLLALQLRTALRFAGLSLTPDVPHPPEEIERAMSFLSETRTARWLALQQRQEVLDALQAPIPMRGELADDILLDHGILPERIFLRPPLIGFPAVGGHVPPISKTAREIYLDGERSLDGIRLPDVNAQFNQTFTEYKTGIRQAVAFFNEEAIQDLPQEDRIFWEEGKAHILIPAIQREYFVGLHAFLEDLNLEAKPFSALVAITHEEQTRHYLAAMSNGQARLIRYLAGDLPREAKRDPEKAGILHNTLFPHIDDLFTEPDKVRAAELRHWKLAPHGASGKPVAILAQYFVEAIEKLRGQAYQPTPDQQALQRIRDGVLSLIPFHDCVTEVQAGNKAAAALTCPFDVVGLIPLAGAALKAGAAAGRLSVQVGSSVLRQLAHTSAKGMLSRQTLRTVIAEIAQAAPQAMSLARNTGKAVLWNALDLADPGLQSAANIGKGVLRGGQALVRSLRQSPKLQALANRVSAALKQQLSHFNERAGVWQIDAPAVALHDDRRFAQIGAHKLEVIDLGDDLPRVLVGRVTGDADAGFLLANPDGRLYGPPLVMSADGLADLTDYRASLARPVRPPNEQGIVHIGQQNYIEMDDQYYLVRQDADRQTWRIVREADPDNAPIPIHYDTGHGRWEVQRTSLSDLPPETQSEVVMHLSDADIENLSQADPYWNAVLEHERRAGRLTDQAHRVDNLEQMRKLLGGEGIENLRMPLRERPLTQLAQRLDALPEQEQEEAFRALCNAIVTLRPQYRERLLTELANRFGNLPGPNRLTAFHYLCDAVVALPSQYQRTPLAALANRLSELGPQLAASRQGAYERLFDAASELEASHRAEPLAALAGQIELLGSDHPQLARQYAFDYLLRETIKLDATYRAAPLAALPAALPHLSENARQYRFDLVFAEAGNLPIDQRAEPLAALAAQIGVLPEVDRQSVFDGLLDWVRGRPMQQDAAAIPALDAPQRAGPLARLAAVLPDLPTSERQGRFDLVLREAAMLPLEHRAAPLTSLSAQIGVLPADHRQSSYTRLLWRIDALPAPQRSEPLTTLTNQVSTLPGEMWLQPFHHTVRAAVRLDILGDGAPLARMAESFIQLQADRRLAAAREILNEIVRLGPERCSGLYTRLARHIPRLPADQRLRGFDEMFEEALLLPDEQRAVSLASLAEQIGALPQAERQSGFDRLMERVRGRAAQQETEALPALDMSYRGRPLAALAEAIPHLPESVLPEFTRLNRFDLVLDEADALSSKRRAGPLASLAAQIDILLEADQQSAFDRLLDRISGCPAQEGIDAIAGLDAQHRALPLAALSAQIDVFPEVERQFTFTRMLERIKEIPAQLQAATLEALANEIPTLPEAEQPPSFDNVVRAAVGLDDGGHGAPLTHIVNSLVLLQPGRQLTAIRTFLSEIEGLGPQRRSELYTQLTRYMRQLPPDPRAHGFEAVLDATTGSPTNQASGLSANHRGAPLMELANSLLWIPDDRRLETFKRILGQIRELPVPHRDRLLQTLTNQVRWLPPEQRPAAFDGLISATDPLEAGLRGEPLMRLARIVGLLPEERQATAFDQLIHATAPLDAGLRSEQLLLLAHLDRHFPARPLAAFRSLLRTVGTLAEEQRGAHYMQFAWLIGRQPEHLRRELFDAILSAVGAHGVQYRSGALWALTFEIHSLPRTLQLGAVSGVYREMNMLVPQIGNEMLTTLAWQCSLQPVQQLDMFETVTRASALTPPQNQKILLSMLIGAIRSAIPPAYRARAWRSILRGAEALDPLPRSIAYDALANRIASVQSEEDRRGLFNELLRAIGRRPSRDDAAPLDTLTENISLLPEPQRPAVLARIEHIRRTSIPAEEDAQVLSSGERPI